MKVKRAWKYRIYPSKKQEKELNNYLHNCKTLWNALLEHTKKYYDETKKFPTKAQLCYFTKKAGLFSQVAQNVADKLVKSLKGMIAKKKSGKKAGFPRFKSIERMRSFTYPQFGFKLSDKLELSDLGNIAIKKHRDIQGQIKTLTIKKSPSRKWHAIFTSEVEKETLKKKQGSTAGIDLGVEHFAYLSNGEIIENPRHLKKAEEKLKKIQRNLSKKKKGGKNRRKARLKVARSHEKVANTRRDFLHKTSKKLVESFSFIAMENLNIQGLTKGFLAKYVLDCSWAEFLSILHYKAVEAGSEIVLVNPAHTSQRCSSCGLVQKKSLAERWHRCLCGASMHRDFNAAKNILTRATHGQWESKAWGKDCAGILEEPGSPESPQATSPKVSL
jgi:putative transposase